MKIGTAQKKIAGGKLLRIDVTFDDFLRKIKITGDFFMHPEETISTLESTLTGMKVPLDFEHAKQILENVLKEKQAKIIGMTCSDIIETLEEALS